MQKLLTLIFLSSLVSCGQKLKPSGPDPIIDGASREEQNLFPAGVSPGWAAPSFELLAAYDEDGSSSLKEIDKMEVSERHFYGRYKEQYKNPVHAMEILELENVWYFKKGAGNGKHLFSLRTPGLIELRSASFKIFDRENPDHMIMVEVDSPVAERIDFEVDLSGVLSSATSLGLAVRDFTVKGEGEGSSFLSKKKSALKNHYRLHIEVEGTRSSYFIPKGRDIKGGLELAKIDYRDDMDGNISSIMGVAHASASVDINNYSDDVGFWKIINSPEQSLNYVPSAGQDILIKLVTMKDMRQRVAKTKVLPVSGKGTSILINGSEDGESWEVRKLDIALVTPYQAIEKRSGIRAGGRGPFIKTCHYFKLSKGLKKEKISLERLLDGVSSDGAGKVVFNRQSVTLPAKMVTLATGLKDENCGRQGVLLKDKNGRFGLVKKSFPTTYEYIGEVLERQRL